MYNSYFLPNLTNVGILYYIERKRERQILRNILYMHCSASKSTTNSACRVLFYAFVANFLWFAVAANRMDGFVRVALRSNGNIPPPPAGFAEFGEELVAFIASFRRLVSYNHAVFGEYFLQLLSNKQRNSAEPTAEASSSSSLSTNLAQTAKP